MGERERINIQEILDDPKLRKDLMIRSMMAAREVAGKPPLSYDEAEEVYDRLQEQKQQRSQP